LILKQKITTFSQLLPLVTVAKTCIGGKYIASASERVALLSLPGVIYKRRNAVFTQSPGRQG
jgi:hypothetical protein